MEVSIAANISYTYDADGRLVKRWDGQATVYIGELYEKNLSTGQETKYYTLGGRRVAVRQAGVTRYELSQRRGPVTWIRDIRATQKYYHVRVKDAGEFIIGGVDAAKMWGAAVNTWALTALFTSAGVLSCQTGGPPGCAAGAMLVTTAVPASVLSARYLTTAATKYTRHWWEHSLDITP